MFEINTARLDDGEKRFEGEIPGSILEIDDENDGRPAGPIRYDLKASLVTGNLLVKGKLEADIEFACFRCGESYKATVKDFEFLRLIKLAVPDECVNLTEDIRESIILAFPTKPLCKPGCKGLCGRCGKNLNKGKCGCASRSVENRWSALDGLKLR